MFTIAEIHDLRLEARELRLKGREILKQYSDEELQKIFNGIGPDRFPAPIRAALDVLHPALVVVAFIHDIRYYEGGKRSDFYAANTEFRENGYIVAKKLYGWYNPRRYRVRFFARKFAKICDLFGWEGYTKK